MNHAIKVDGISKRYRVGVRATDEYRTLRESLVGAATGPMRRLRARAGRSAPPRGDDGPAATPPGEFWALKDVSFEVEPGEVVGIIGRNGAGKSTLLKILSRITEPTAGHAEFRGRIGSLLEVGTGFHPELTGRENIYLNGSILGMSRREVARKFDEIVAFSEIEAFLDTPVKRYSSGMYVRLAFAVAAHLEPEILLIDEVLAVGDHGFQKKCLGKMREVGRSGRTVLFVSHNMTAVEALCRRCILVERGRVKAEGETSSVLARYYELGEGRSNGESDLKEHGGREGGSLPVMTRVTLGDGEDRPVSGIRMGSPLEVNVEVDLRGVPTRPVLGVVLKTDLGSPLFGVNNRFIPGYEFGRTDRTGTITCYFPTTPLMPGMYSIDLYFGNEHRDIDVIHEAVALEVIPADVFASGKLPPKAAGPIFCPATWAFHKKGG